MRPLLGPLLGHVSDDTAVAWIRMPSQAPLALAEASSRPLTGARRDDPSAIAATPLQAVAHGDGTAAARVPLRGGGGELHEIEVRMRSQGARPIEPLGTLRVRAAEAPADEGRIAFAFASCWRVDAFFDATATWRDLLALHRGGHVDHLMLLGDQIYADETPVLTSLAGRTAIKRAERLGPSASLQRRASGWREAYQRAWEPAEVRAVLASVPTTSIWDDHEIVNGWGSEPWHRQDRGRAIFEPAAAAFDEFQGSRNPPPLEPSSRAHAFRRGPAAFLTLDLRTHRNAEDGVLLGSRQKEAIAGWLRSEWARSARVLFVACSVPLLHLSRFFHAVRGRSDLRDQWSSRENKPERAWLLARLLEYEEGGRRRVVLLGGDSHLATAASLTGPDGRVRWQVTSSPMAHRLPALVYPALTLFGRRFPVRAEGSSSPLRAHVFERWQGPNVGVITGTAGDRDVSLTFELFRPGRRTVKVDLSTEGVRSAPLRRS